MPVIPSIELVSYVAWIFYNVAWIFFAMIGLYIYLQAFRNQISWGQARRMGIPKIIYTCMKFIYVLVAFYGAYLFVSFILDLILDLDWPIWIGYSLFLVVQMLSLGIYLKLLHRKKFKPELFVALFLVPLSIPGIPTAAKLIHALILR